jgi:hypothetical protein
MNSQSQQTPQQQQKNQYQTVASIQKNVPSHTQPQCQQQQAKRSVFIVDGS